MGSLKILRLFLGSTPRVSVIVDAMHRRNLEGLELGFVLSLRQQTIKHFPASDSL
jgi:hypothetical protein